MQYVLLIHADGSEALCLLAPMLHAEARRKARRAPFPVPARARPEKDKWKRVASPQTLHHTRQQSAASNSSVRSW